MAPCLSISFGLKLRQGASRRFLACCISHGRKKVDGNIPTPSTFSAGSTVSCSLWRPLAFDFLPLPLFAGVASVGATGTGTSTGAVWDSVDASTCFFRLSLLEASRTSKKCDTQWLGMKMYRALPPKGSELWTIQLRVDAISEVITQRDD